MGIPKFYSFIAKKFPGVVTTTLDDGDKADWLYFDYNSLIHPAVHKSMGLGKNEDKFHEEIFQYTMDVIRFVDPQVGIFFAVDGVAPRAKMIQQRDRRYKSVMEKKLTKMVSDHYGVSNNEKRLFDTNAITPGTTFMVSFTKKLSDFCDELRSDGINGHSIKITCSSSDEPSEGEHKIMQILRDLPEDDVDIHCIYGLDADLIMLSMIQDRDIVLVREKMTFGSASVDGTFNYLDINKLKESIGKYYSDVLKYISLQQMCNDFVYLCFYLGNDFLPSIPSLSIKNNGINIIMNTYRSKMNKFMVPLLDDEFNVNHLFIGSILTHLSNTEQDLFKAFHNKEFNRRPFSVKKKKHDGTVKTALEIDTENVLVVSGKQVDTLMYNKNGYHDRHYTYYFDWKYSENGRNASGVKPITDEFFRGISWCTQYYFIGCPSWKWHYPYNAAPLMSDLASNIPDNLLYSFSKSQPFLPWEQLMLVLPKESIDLVPSRFHNVMKTSDMYPDNFTVDAIGKTFFWECKPRLPYMDSEKLWILMVKSPFDGGVTEN